jgi:DNA-binding NarL/FixJ family response regulator
MIMNSHRQIAVIAPERMLDAFSVLINSAPNIRLQASSNSLNELQKNLGENQPDVILVYLVQESGLDNDRSALEIIRRIKSIWPDVLCVTILKYAAELEKAKEIGSDLALVDGVSAERLLAAIEGPYM